MLRTNSKKATENLKNYISDDLYYLEERNDYRSKNGGNVYDLRSFEGIASLIVDIFHEEKKNEARFYKNERAMFEDWAQGLALGNLFCYYYNRSATDDIKSLLEETEAEASRYAEEQACSFLTNWIYETIKKYAVASPVNCIDFEPIATEAEQTA